jgi:hypothetical protein
MVGIVNFEYPLFKCWARLCLGQVATLCSTLLLCCNELMIVYLTNKDSTTTTLMLAILKDMYTYWLGCYGLLNIGRICTWRT